LVSESQLELERSENDSETGKQRKKKIEGRRKTHPFLGSLHVTTQL
jgi:hypothetical protein